MDLIISEKLTESRKCQKGGGGGVVNHSGLVQNLSEENIMNTSLSINLCQNVKKLCLAFIQSCHIPYFLRAQGSQFYNTGQSLSACQLTGFLTWTGQDKAGCQYSKA